MYSLDSIVNQLKKAGKQTIQTLSSGTGGANRRICNLCDNGRIVHGTDVARLSVDGSDDSYVYFTTDGMYADC